MNLSIKPKNVVLGIYFGGVLSYNLYTVYFNGTEQLNEYRKNKQFFKNELDAVICGTQKHWFENLLLSLFWPIRLPFKLLPIMILFMHDKEDTKESFIQYEIKKYVNIRNPSDNEKIKYIQTIDKMKNNSFESKKENIETFKETIAPTKEVEPDAAKEEINKPVEPLPESSEEETSKDNTSKQLEEIKLISAETEFQFNDDGQFSFTL
jgi:hypothetical protein